MIHIFIPTIDLSLAFLNIASLFSKYAPSITIIRRHLNPKGQIHNLNYLHPVESFWLKIRMCLSTPKVVFAKRFSHAVEFGHTYGIFDFGLATGLLTWTYSSAPCASPSIKALSLFTQAEKRSAPFALDYELVSHFQIGC